MKLVIYGLVFALAALPVAAREQQSQPWYEVEIILFERLDPAAMKSEQWPQEVVEPTLDGSIELLRQPPAAEPVWAPAADAEIALQSSAEAPMPYLILPPGQYRLSEAYQKLADSADYLPYVHVAWRQIIPPRETPDRIFVHDQLNAPLEEEPNAAAVPSLGPETPSAVDIPADDMFIEQALEFSPPAHTLSGVISIGVGRYLHVDADLLLHKPQPDKPAEEEVTAADNRVDLDPPPPFADELTPDAVMETEQPTPEFFRIQGNLRMRSGEVHYLDHPLVGMLILFTPYTPPEPAEAEAPATPDNAAEPFVDLNQSSPTLSPQ